jgi:hypothetical protein
MFGDQRAADGSQVALNGFPLRIQTKTGSSLPIRRDPVVSDELSCLGLHNRLR